VKVHLLFFSLTLSCWFRWCYCNCWFSSWKEFFLSNKSNES